MKVLRSSNS